MACEPSLHVHFISLKTNLCNDSSTRLIHGTLWGCLCPRPSRTQIYNNKGLCDFFSSRVDLSEV